MGAKFKDKMRKGKQMQGSLHCAIRDKTANRFGRDDGVYGPGT
jgi:hypothetical protein